MTILILRSSASAGGGGGGGGGSFAHGDLVTINGSGFGTRADNNFDGLTWQGRSHIHYRWCDFGATFPANGSSQATWQAALGGYIPVEAFNFQGDLSGIQLTQQSGGPSQSGKYFRRVGYEFASSGGIGVLTSTSAPIPTSTKSYACWKQRGDIAGKIFRMWQDGVGENFYLGDSGAFRESDWPYDGTAFYQNYAPSNTVFKRGELFMDPDATAQTQFTFGGSLISYEVYSGGNQVLPAPTKMPLTNSGDSGRGLWYEWPNAVDTGSAFEATDIYLDWTHARVEVTDGTKSEIQLVNSWANTQIKFSLNKGELAAGTRTVKVFDATNSVIATQSITIT